MKTEKILKELTDAAGRIGLKVRTVKGNFDGGRCAVAGEEVVMLNGRHLPEHRLAVLARALRSEEMDAVYLPPAVRQALEDVWDEQGGERQADGAEARDATGEEVPARAE